MSREISGKPAILVQLSLWLLRASLFVAPTLGIFAPLGFAPLFVVMALAALPLLRLRGAGSWPNRGIMSSLAAFHLWHTLSLIWAISFLQALRTSAATAATTLGGLILHRALSNLSDGQRRWLLQAAIRGCFLAAAVFLVEALWGAPIRTLAWSLLSGGERVFGLLPTRLNRGTTVLAMLSLPVAAILYRHGQHRGLILLCLLMVLVAAASSSSTARICIFLGAGIGLAAAFRPRLALLSIRGIIVLLIVGMPLAVALMPAPSTIWRMLPSLPNSAHHRLTVWKFAAERIADRPMVGWGMDSSRDLPGGQDQVWVRDNPRGGPPYREQLMPLHPHNSPLQWWLELGAVGALLGSLVVWSLVSALRRLGVVAQAVGLGLAVQVATVSISSFGAWQSWWLAAIWIIGLLVPMLDQPEIKASGPDSP